MKEIKEKYNIEILSPKVLKSTHDFMNKHSGLTINNFLEVYLLLLTPIDFDKFCSKHTIKNKWMWGVGSLFGYYNIRVGVLNSLIVEHMLSSKANKTEANNLMNEYLIAYTEYKSIKEIRNNFCPIKETIDL